MLIIIFGFNELTMHNIIITFYTLLLASASSVMCLYYFWSIAKKYQDPAHQQYCKQVFVFFTVLYSFTGLVGFVPSDSQNKKKIFHGAYCSKNWIYPPCMYLMNSIQFLILIFFFSMFSKNFYIEESKVPQCEKKMQI